MRLRKTSAAGRPPERKTLLRVTVQARQLYALTAKFHNSSAEKALFDARKRPREADGVDGWMYAL